MRPYVYDVLLRGKAATNKYDNLPWHEPVPMLAMLSDVDPSEREDKTMVGTL